MNIDPLKLVRDGTHQEQRLVPALDPEYAPVNDRDVAHGMIFAKSFSEFLQYYDETNTVSGNWSGFFSLDPSVILATCVVQDIDQYKAVVQTCFEFLNNIDNDTDNTGVKENLSWLFAYAATIAMQLDAVQSSLPNDISLRATLRNLIQSRLAPSFARLISYYKADLALTPAKRLILNTLPTADADHTVTILGASPVTFDSVFTNGLSSIWITDSSPDWATFRTAIVADASVFGDPLGTIFERANHIAVHNLFTGVFDQLLKALSRLVVDADVSLQETLTNYDKHEPHYALFLSFLQLLEYARASANTLTARHLDFYYRDILQLSERPAEPARAHLVLEPQKNVVQSEVVVGTQFKAGKDANGTEILFANDLALVVNQGVVSSMKKLFRFDGELFVSQVANSDDGVTDVLASDDKSWHPFFNGVFDENVLESVTMTPAAFSFGIASHYLLLAEGTRSITITFTMSDFGGTIGTDYASGVVCSFTGEEGWFDVAPSSFIATNATTLQLTVEVDGDQPAIIGADAKIHALDIQSFAPVMKVTLTHSDAEDYLFGVFENVVITDVTLNVSVDRVKQLTLSNDFGPVDSSKPFLPFGAQPEKGSSLIITSQEMFSKRDLQDCTLNINWKNLPSENAIAYLPFEEYDFPGDDFYDALSPWALIYSLVKGDWSYQTFKYPLFDVLAPAELDIKPLIQFNPNDDPAFTVDASYTTAAKTAFVKIGLPFGMGHVQYRNAIADYALSVANGGSPPKPVAPYTPEVESIFASYSATQVFQTDANTEAAFNGRQARLYHITDLGFAEQHAYLKAESPDASTYLFPQVRHLNNFDDALPDLHPVTHEGEFYIGVKGLVPPLTLTMLFQVVDGTANPLAEKPDPHIQWSYLQDNEWLPFQDNDVVDGTDDLLKSGIVSLAIPREATSTNTLLPSELHWIRIAVEKKADAVCKLVLVAAQAVEVELQNVDTTVGAELLASGTISKLAQPDAAIKKVNQPFATFDGKGAEDPNDFYARISERLRHKDRAITIWDIEHLVLEAFPEIYRVKCLNHTHYEPTENSIGIYRELAPGHITVITIPDQVGLTLVNPLKPYTSLGVLEEIKDYLEARLTCFATLHVKNPQFEEVRIECRVKLYDGFDETFYVLKLQEAVTQFLSPWAFFNDAHPSFGGRIYQSALINFIEEQEYVDYLTDFQLFQDIGGVQSTVSKQFVEGSKAVSILVSAPSDEHIIHVIDANEEESLQEQCECEE